MPRDGGPYGNEHKHSVTLQQGKDWTLRILDRATMQAKLNAMFNHLDAMRDPCVTLAQNNT